MDINRVYLGDCLEIMPSIPDKSIDLILADPPYFLPAAHYQTRKQFNRNFSDLGVLEHFIKDAFKEFTRVVKDNGSIYIFCDGQSYPLFYYYLYPYCKSVRPLIWDKITSFNGYGWRHQFEMIIYAEMPLMKPIPTGDGDILRCHAVKVDNREHPAEKPVKIIEQIISKSTIEGGIVCDPFAGSGTTGVACQNLKRNYILIEKEPKYYDIILKRLLDKQVVLV